MTKDDSQKPKTEEVDAVETYINFNPDRDVYHLTFYSNFQLDKESLIDVLKSFVLQISEGDIDPFDEECEWSEQ